jgi:hypothetical protein
MGQKRGCKSMNLEYFYRGKITFFKNPMDTSYPCFPVNFSPEEMGKKGDFWLLSAFC